MASVESAAGKRFSFYHHDNATFRRDNTKGYHGVDDVLDERTMTWVPYRGDQIEPVWFGSETGDPLANEAERTDDDAL